MGYLYATRACPFEWLRLFAHTVYRYNVLYAHVVRTITICRTECRNNWQTQRRAEIMMSSFGDRLWSATCVGAWAPVSVRFARAGKMVCLVLCKRKWKPQHGACRYRLWLWPVRVCVCVLCAVFYTNRRDGTERDVSVEIMYVDRIACIVIVCVCCFAMWMPPQRHASGWRDAARWPAVETAADRLDKHRWKGVDVLLWFVVTMFASKVTHISLFDKHMLCV